jgi:hypothetical protein
MEVTLLSWAHCIKYSIQYSLWHVHYSYDDVLTGCLSKDWTGENLWLGLGNVWQYCPSKFYDGLWSAHPCVARHCHKGTTLLKFLLWNKLSEGENSDFLVFIVVRVYCCTHSQEFHKCNTGLILWFFLLATTIEFFIDCILSVAVWILVQMVVPFFILCVHWQWEAITSYIILVEKISGECSPYSFVCTSQHLGHPTNIDLGTA